MEQSEQGKFFGKEWEIGKENLETRDFKIGNDGWPSLECQEGKSVFGDGEAKKRL